jgi:hypothetical protein
MEVAMKASRWLTTATMCVVVFSFPSKVSASLIGLDLAQINFNQGPDSLANSNWGSATASFTGQLGFQYFNLVLNGSWQVQNAPVWSLGGLGPQSMVFNFDLGNTPGSNVSSAGLIASLTAAPLGSAPGGPSVPTMVGDREVTVGGLGGPLGPIPGAVPLIGNLPVDWAFNMGMPNQDVGVDECVPGAFSNSLMWLDDRDASFSIPGNLKSVAGLKGPTNWDPPATDANGKPIPGTGGTPVNAWEGKRDALKDYVTTRFIQPGNIAQALAEMKRGEDIEVWGHHHAAVATGLIQNLDGTWGIYVTHDTNQGTAGGTVTEFVTFDPATGLLTGGAPGFFDGAILRGFVDESPVPEPSTVLMVSLGVLLLLLRKTAVRS